MAVFGKQLRLTGAPRFARLENAGSDQEIRADGGGASNPPDGVGAGAAANAGSDVNLNNILLLIPGDIVAVYMTGKGIDATKVAEGSPFIQNNWPLICFVACLLACFLFRLQASKPEGESGLLSGTNLSLAFWTTVAFFLWGHAVSDTSPLIPGFSGAIAAFVAGLFGVFAPRLVRADAPG